MASRRFDITTAQVIEAFENNGRVIRRAADALGIHNEAVRIRLKTLQRKGIYDYEQARGFKSTQNGEVTLLRPEFEISNLPDEELPTEQLIEYRKRQFKQRQKYEDAVRLIGVKVKLDGPIGLLHFGDPHLDDDGTDVELIEQHCAIVQNTKGLFATCVGDMTNNWVGRLAKLYAEQSTSGKQAWQLADWFMGLLRGHLLYLIGGNHDLFSGHGDPLQWIARQNDALYKASECRLELLLPNGQRPRINARHDFSGHSLWNPAHGPMKALQLGVRDHIAIAGHKHESAYSILKCPDTGITMHAVKVSTYKTYDRYQKEKGFRDQTISPCALTTINAALPDTHPDYIKVFWDAETGADYLNYLRARYT